MSPTGEEREELPDWSSDRALWRRSCLTDVTEDEASRFLDLAARAHLARCRLYSPVAAAAYLARLRSMGEPCRRDGVGELAGLCHGKRHVAHAQCSGRPERCQFCARAVR